ncbi:MAG TPA: hypothetical protein VFR27_17640 [Mycobacterium sp.]|nr:hypothetical protein [Mycobacterium sp.]
MNAVSPVPGAVRSAGAIVALQGAAALVVAAALVLRGLAGADQRVVGGVSLAVCFGLIGAGVLGTGWALTRGKRWGRGAAVFANLLLLPVAWYVAVGSHRWAYGLPIGVVALAVLGLLFSPAALRWVAQRPALTGL